MSETARIDSISELRAFRVALVKFVDACNVALGDAESDMQRTLTWLERDQLSYWQGQLAKRTENVSRAKDALRQKKLYKSPTGHTQSVVDEEKALRVAIRMQEEAEQKIVACKQWARRLQKEIMMYKGGVTRLTSVLGGDVPRALAQLEVMASSLEAYAALGAGAAVSAGAGGGVPGAFSDDALGSMARSADQTTPTPRHAGVIDVTAIRAAAPPADVRAQAPPTDIRDEPWSLPPIGVEARKAVVGLNVSITPSADAQTLIVAKGTQAAPRIALQRLPAADGTDSGWYVAPADLTGITGLSKVLVRDLLEIRPDFRELLSLPPEFLVVIDEQGVRTLLTPVGEELWPADAPGSAG